MDNDSKEGVLFEEKGRGEGGGTRTNGFGQRRPRSAHQSAP